MFKVTKGIRDSKVGKVRAFKDLRGSTPGLRGLKGLKVYRVLRDTKVGRVEEFKGLREQIPDLRGVKAIRDSKALQMATNM